MEPPFITTIASALLMEGPDLVTLNEGLTSGAVIGSGYLVATTA